MMQRRPRLTIDVGYLFDAQWTGLAVFTRRLIRALQRHGGIDMDFASDLVRLSPARVNEALAMRTGVYLSDDFESRRTEGYGVVDPATPIFYPANKRRAGLLPREASVVHDLTTLFMPDTHDPTNVAHHLDYFVRELASDEAIFCPSEATRASLTLALPSTKSKARLLPQYVDWPSGFEAMDRNAPPIRLGRYAVVVGTIEPRKNLRLLAEALARPETERLGLSFIVIGKDGWGEDAFANLSPEQRRRVRFTGFVSEFVKYRLIRSAEFLIYPALAEGFGIPALEAMSLGKPVLASRSTSLPEVIEDAGIYFDPFSIGDFIGALQTIAGRAKLAELGGKARIRARAFTSERMAQPVVAWAMGE